MSTNHPDGQLNELGYYAVTRHPADVRVVLPEARAAEALGLGSCHIGERFTVKDPAVLSGAVAGCSTTLGIAPSTNHHTRHPTVTATIGSTMHALTEGRFAMAFGRGMAGYWPAVGLPVVTEARLRDFFGILRRLWAGEMILDHDGPAGKWPMLRHASGLGEGPPIGLVAVGPKTMELAGEICDFVVLHTFFSDEATEKSVAAVRRGAERAGRDPDSVRIWACLATVPDALPADDQLRRGVGRLATYLQAYPDVLVSANGWDRATWDRIRQSELFTDAAAAGPIDASASVETLERIAELIPAEWLASAASGSPQDCAKTIARQYDLGVHSAIMHGASPHELEPVVRAYRADRPTLRRAVAANPREIRLNARESPQAIRAQEQWRAAVPSAVIQSAAGTRLNKRGLETRARLLDVAIRCLADSGGDPVSANRIAKDADVTWGTVQHQFGDLDGLWVAVITEIHSRSWVSNSDTWPSRSGTLRERVGSVIDSVWAYLDTNEGRALTALRTSLPPRRSDIAVEYPQTASAFAARELDWIQGFDYLMDGLDLDPDQLYRVRCLLPAAIRGLSNERQIGFTSDLDIARATLTDAVVALLSQPRS